MAYSFTLDDIAFVQSADGAAAVRRATGLDLDAATLIRDLTVLRHIAGDHAAAIAETVRLRRKAAGRWGPGGSWSDWLFTDEALQQASPPPAAAHRARRLLEVAAREKADAVHDLTCSIGSDVVAIGHEAIARGSDVMAVGSDLDLVRLAMARVNLLSAGVRPALVRADARTITTRGAVRYADPARRDGTGRRISTADTVPSVSEMIAANRSRPPVLRLPPALDYAGLSRGGEVELVSWQGVVRELVWWPAWTRDDDRISRRATLLLDAGATAECYTDADPVSDDITAPRRYLVDPDPAVVRAHLVEHFAARHDLTRLDEHLAYLTGDTPPPRGRAFEICDAAQYSDKTVRAWAHRDGVGTVEIKQRGTPLVPDDVRRKLRLRGDTRVERTLIIARIGTDLHAFWCRSTRA